VYVLDYDEKDMGDALRCLSLDDGREIWRRGYKFKIKRNHGRSRTVPAVTDRFTVTLGPACHVLCVASDSGDFLWGMDLKADFGTTVPMWYSGQCPLIDGSTVVLAPGGSALLMGVDAPTGNIVWQTPNPHKWQMSHSSVIPMTILGRRMYVYCAVGGMASVAADGEDRGEILWETTEWNHRVVAPSPVLLDGDRIFVTAGYGVGSRIFQIERKDGAFTARALATFDKTTFACEQQTPIYTGGFLYTVQPNDAGPTKRQVACMHTDGKIAWTSGPSKRFGLGPYLVADGKMFILRDDGVLTMIRASSKGYWELAQAKVLPGRDAWGPMALVNGRLLLRDWRRLICLDVRKQ
jgi:outer membrane protein assembly factor BamB